MPKNSPAKASQRVSADSELAFFSNFTDVMKGEIEAKKKELENNSKALEVDRENNGYLFELEKERIKTSRDIYSKQVENSKIYIISLLFILLVVVVGTFVGIFYGKTEDVTKVALPIITAIVGAAGGYGFGLNKGRKEKDDEE